MDWSLLSPLLVIALAVELLDFGLGIGGWFASFSHAFIRKSQ
jgi:hypothetical protein